MATSFSCSPASVSIPIVAFGTALVLTGTLAFPQQAEQVAAPDDSRRDLSATLTSDPIIIDGVLDEAIWGDAAIAKGFVQSEPRQGEPAVFDTEVRVVYDTDNLYVGVFCHDDDPASLVIRDMTRDYNARSVDTFGVVLDTFHDKRNGYLFHTNPRGAKFDLQFLSEGQESNSDWDGVWHVEAQIVENGWTAEFAIPFKTVKFDADDEQTWGINFLRRNRRYNEDSFWAPIPRVFRATRVSLAGELNGIRGVRSGANVKVTPYATGNISTADASSRQEEFDGGLDAKVGIGSGLTLDLTLNTDFSQIEADVQQVNLTRFSLFFPEKRDFFLENSGVFRFGPPENARRRAFRNQFGLAAGSAIGGGQSRGNDLLLFFSRRIGLSSDGDPLPVRGGGRLTGRVGPYQLGFLNMQTGEEIGLGPGENFTVARVKRNVFANSDVGVMFINRDTVDSDHFNRSLGVDANFRLNPNMDLNAFAAKTSSPDTSGEDWAGRVAYSFRSNNLDFESSFTNLQDNFNPEVGFAPRTGVKRASVSSQYRHRQSFARSWLREISANIDVDNFNNQEGDVVSRYFNTRFTFRMQNGGFWSVGTRTSLEQPVDTFDITDDVIIQPGRFRFTDYFTTLFTDPSHVVSFTANVSTGNFFSGTRNAYTFGGAAKLNGRLTAEALWSYNDVELIEGAFTTHLVTSRFTYAFNTTMFLNGLVQYNSLESEWASNIRFNWIHRPLSDFFIVFNERRGSDGVVLDRALVAKFTYLLEF